MLENQTIIYCFNRYTRIENYKSKVITESKIVKDCNTYQNIERVSLKNQSPKRFYIQMSQSSLIKRAAL